MNIGFVGLGKLGLPVALAVEDKGHKVFGFDISPSVEEILTTKKLPYREEGAQELLEATQINFCDLDRVVTESEIIFVPVQTPHDPDYEGITRLPDDRVDFDYQYLKSAMKDLSQAVERQDQKKVVIIISTVLPGTVEKEILPILCDNVQLCYNPFFIAMGTTITDFLFPEFILFGVDDTEAADKAEEFYKTINSALFFKTSIRNAELTKVAYNTFIGMKIVFANTIMEICHKTGGQSDEVSKALGLATKRLVSDAYMRGGMGDGGGCHPRDNIALSWLSRELDLSYDWFESVMLARERQTEWLADLMESYSLPKVILGKAFKPETNLTTGSPSILLKNILLERGHTVQMYDPYLDEKTPDFGPSVFLIGTMHQQFKSFEFPRGSIVLDPWRFIPEIDGVEVIPVGG